MFYFEFFDFWEKNCKGGKTSKQAPWPQCGLPRHDEAGRPKRPPHRFAAVKLLFTRGKIFILFPKVSYSCTDSLRTLIND